jgi:hypothetical protein
MEQALEPRELVRIREDDLGDRRAVGAAGPDDSFAPALTQRRVDLFVLTEQPVDDRVARRRRGAVTLEGA